MKALSCPRCGAPLQTRLPRCPYCGVGLEFDETLPQPQPRYERQYEPKSAPIPEGWVNYRDPWHGFCVNHPYGWQVFTLQGQISIREDPVGIVSAIIWPYTLQIPMNAHQVGMQLVNVARMTNPSFNAWQQDNAAPESNRVTIRTQLIRFGHQREGTFNILVDGRNVIVSGYETPAGKSEKSGPQMSQILSSFKTCEMMPRQLFRDPTEDAFTLYTPEGWTVQGGINRNYPGGSGMAQFTATRDAHGLVRSGMPWYLWNYMDGLGGFFGSFGMYPALKFTPAAQYCQQAIAPWMGQSQKDFKIEAINDRPDLSDILIQDLARSGYPPGTFEVTAAVLESSYNESNIRIRQKSLVMTQRQRGMVAMMGGAPIWTAGLQSYYQAPETEFENWEPILNGIIDSLQMNPAWQMRERQQMQGQIANIQQDTLRRTRQISQTLSETSDIITNSYWNRQSVYDRISEQRSNVTLGVQNVASAYGDVYKVPNGYDQYWMDGLGNFYGGSWMTQPDINWTPLEPTGI